MRKTLLQIIIKPIAEIAAIVDEILVQIDPPLR